MNKVRRGERKEAPGLIAMAKRLRCTSQSGQPWISRSRSRSGSEPPTAPPTSQPCSRENLERFRGWWVEKRGAKNGAKITDLHLMSGDVR